MEVHPQISALTTVFLTPADISQIEYALRVTDFSGVLYAEDSDDAAKVNRLSEQFTNLAESIDTMTL